MPNFNKVILIGHLTRDIEIKSAGSSTVGGFSIGINRKWKSREGEKREKASFIDCKAWGKTAEHIGQYFKKGDAILIEGFLDQESWEAKDGGKRSKLVVQVDRWEFVGGKKSSGRDETDDRVAAHSRGDDSPDGDQIPF